MKPRSARHDLQRWALCAGLVVVTGCASEERHGAIVFQSNRDGNFEIYVMNADGSQQRRLTASPANDFSPRWSPDGSTIAFASDRDGRWEIYTVGRDGSGLRRLTHGQGNNTAPSWSPDGKRILFVSTRDAPYGEIYAMKPDGSEVRRLTAHESVKDTPVMSGDGKTIFLTLNDRGKLSIGEYSLTDYTMRAITPAECNSLNPRLRTDGALLLYVSDRGGTVDLYGQPVGGGAPERITADPGVETSACWTSDPGQVLVAKNYAIVRLSLESHRETLLSSGGDSAPDWTSH